MPAPVVLVELRLRVFFYAQVHRVIPSSSTGLATAEAPPFTHKGSLYFRDKCGRVGLSSAIPV